MKNQKSGLIVAIVLLAIALVGSLVWGTSTSTKVDKLQADKLAVTASLDEVSNLRDQLAAEVDSLVLQYDELATENNALQGQMAQSQEDLSRAQAALNRAKRNSATEMKDLRAQIEELQQIKQDLQMNMDAMLAQNDSLKLEIGVLENDLAMSTSANTTLTEDNLQKEGEIKALTYETFKATSFEIAPQVKSGKATAKSGRAKQIAASFDLEEVPMDYQGVRPIYLVITDATGTPIPRTDYITTTINPLNSEPQNIMAVEVKEEELAASQRLTFVHELENKLDEGTYTLSAYTDVGLLGSSTFRLR